MQIGLKGKLVVAANLLLSIWPLWLAYSHWHSDDIARFLCYATLSALASGLKVTLPGITGTMSVNFLFILIGIADMSYSEVVVMACSGSLVQCLWRTRRRPAPVQILFSISNMAIAVAAPYYLYHWHGTHFLAATPLVLGTAAMLFFILNTAPIAIIVGATEEKSVLQTWRDCYFWSFPFYLLGASIAWVLSQVGRYIHWEGTVLLLPVMYFIYRSYRVYLDKLETEKNHVEQMAALHLRTIEALALAIEAKDHTTHDHLCRVRVYAVEIGKMLGLAEPELDALRAAALLHDIGKLAVPEHIISKPGRLTPEEFAKMKIHPIVGAEILERVNFPYPVVPIVRAHHERWDGCGYPYGLKGTDIPIGARILAAVDHFDALASDRQYRRACSIEEAIEQIRNESGKALDPAVAEILVLKHLELEAIARHADAPRASLSTSVDIRNGEPAAGYQKALAPREERCEFLSSIAAARQEVQLLFELTRDVGTSLSLDETLSVLGIRLRRMVPYDTLVVFISADERLRPAYVVGEEFRTFTSVEMAKGEGISGWVAQTGKPMLNGDPSLEMVELKHATGMKSALSVPLEGVHGTVGVLTLYRGQEAAFSEDHLRILLAICSKVSFSVENALRYRQAENSATTDFLTGLANARSLFLRLDSELARCRRSGEALAVLVCDLNGFKQINDRYGHLEGNRLLRDVAAALRENCREYDYVARMGGDEFVLLLPGGHHNSIGDRVAGIRALAANLRGAEEGGEFLSMSVGVACYPNDGADAEQLLAEADRRMYKAKQEGKRRQLRAGNASGQPDVLVA